jgi:hypothetical protein
MVFYFLRKAGQVVTNQITFLTLPELRSGRIKEFVTRASTTVNASLFGSV